MKELKLPIAFLFFVLLVACPCSSLVAAEDKNAAETARETASLAKLAKAKARLRFEQAQSNDSDVSAVSSFDTAGCDINIGNVALDGLSNSPNEITVIIDGDIIQSNNCR